MEATKKKKVHLDVLHFEHEKWISQLSFYKGELKTYTNRLEGVASKYNGRGAMEGLEKFQNQFIRQNEVIDILKHDINEQENILVESVKNNPVATDHRLFYDHSELRDRVEVFLKIYSELKLEFMRYISKYI